MATHSILAWKISWTEEPGGVQSMVEPETKAPEPQFPPLQSGKTACRAAASIK